LLRRARPRFAFFRLEDFRLAGTTRSSSLTDKPTERCCPDGRSNVGSIR
jgi:hypothetical protein